MFFKIESWNFEHLFKIGFRDTSQNFNSFNSFRQLLFSFVWLSWNFVIFFTKFFFKKKKGMFTDPIFSDGFANHNWISCATLKSRWLPLKVLVACKLTNRFAWPDTDYRIKIADLNFPYYLPKAFEVLKSCGYTYFFQQTTYMSSIYQSDLV